MQTTNLTATPAIAHMQLLSAQLDRLYREMREERRTIAQWEESQDGSVLGVLELFAGDVQGYMEQLTLHSRIANPVAALSHLRTLNVFAIDYVTDWYFTTIDRYPLVKQYIEHLDHLRLLLIEHLSAQMTVV